MSGYSDNAVMAKVRALYGKRLNRQDYLRLSGVKSVGEVAAYLKNETYYADSLSEVREDLIKRGQLETLVRRRVLDTYMRLVKYYCNDRLFMKIYMMKNEIDQLLLAVRLLNSGESERYIISLPVYLSKHMSFDLFALADIRGYEGLLEIVEHSGYYDVMRRFRPASPETPIDITSCETALLSYYYQTLCELVEEQYSGDTRAALLELLYHRIDFHNLTVIYRLKQYFHYPADKIRTLLIPHKSVLSARAYARLLETPGAEEYLEMISRLSPARRYPINPGDDSAHKFAQVIRMKWRLAQKYFRFSTRPVVVLLCYMSLLEIEVDNIINIIEGIRYNISADEIHSLLAI